jgi:hypothetical protein
VIRIELAATERQSFKGDSETTVYQIHVAHIGIRGFSFSGCKMRPIKYDPRPSRCIRRPPWRARPSEFFGIFQEFDHAFEQTARATAVNAAMIEA